MFLDTTAVGVPEETSSVSLVGLNDGCNSSKSAAFKLELICVELKPNAVIGFILLT